MNTATLLASLILLGASALPGQSVRPDSTVLNRDIDGSGKTDYIRIEHKRDKSNEGQQVRRLAIYLDRTPASHKPQWASAWSYEVDMQLDTALTVPSGGSILSVGGSAADASFTTLLFVRHSKLRVVLEHNIDNGYGDFRLQQHGNEITLDASQSNLKIMGREIAGIVRCTEKTPIPMAHLIFDARKEAFILRRQYCSAPVPD